MDTSAAKVRSALKNFSNKTATGCDHFHLRRLAELPDLALAQLGMMFKQSVASLTVPMQDLLNMLSLLGKKVRRFKDHCNNGFLLQGIDEIFLPANPREGR